MYTNRATATINSLRLQARQFSATMAANAEKGGKDWSAAQYLKFEEQRTRPSRDLLAQVGLSSPQKVVDVGCGPGNSTEILVRRYPGASIAGIDSSPNLIDRAKKALPEVDFSVADLQTYKATESLDLIFSNAVLQWVKSEDRIPVIKRLMESLKPGGVLAMQVPDNFGENSHVLMREVAKSGPWAKKLQELNPSHGKFQAPQELYDALIPHCSSVDIWHTIYRHPLDNNDSIVEWFKGTALKSYIDPLPSEQQEEFLAVYLARLKEEYPVSADGKVLLHFPRLFMVATKS